MNGPSLFTDPCQVDPSDVNIFCTSQLWRDQVVSAKCRALDEKEFIVPSNQGCMSSAEGRRNFTDVQETAQWLGGTEIPKAILEGLLSGALIGFNGLQLFPVKPKSEGEFTMVANQISKCLFIPCVLGNCVRRGSQAHHVGECNPL